MTGAEKLRVALLAGELTQGGAEKQLAYIARALKDAGVEVRVFSLTWGEYYESILRSQGTPPVWFGRASNPLIRASALISRLRRYRPQIVHSVHAFANVYAAIGAKCVSAVSIGGLRSDFGTFVRRAGFLGRAVLTLPDAVAVNSRKALADVAAAGWVRRDRLFLLENSLDLAAFQAETSRPLPEDDEQYLDQSTVAFVGSLISVKRVDRFLSALAAAREKNGQIKGVVVGDGPERSRLLAMAADLGLGSGHVRFFGARDDVPAILRRVRALVICSESEGCPNVVLEAMAAGVTVIGTDAGDTPAIVQDGTTGFICSCVSDIAAAILRLNESEGLRTGLARAGQKLIEEHYNLDSLADRVVSIYRAVASAHGRSDIVSATEPPVMMAGQNC
jgi:glycosyltransferase involved in cell wall biosynthesis